MLHFQAVLDRIGINPFVFLPEEIQVALFTKAGKDKGPIPVHGSVNDQPYQQTLIKYAGHWRLYINTNMLADSPNKIGMLLDITIDYDPSDRSILPHPLLVAALDQQVEAKKVFDLLTPSLQKEVVRYISFLKSEESVQKNVDKAIGFLLGKNDFIGRKALKK